MIMSHVDEVANTPDVNVILAFLSNPSGGILSAPVKKAKMCCGVTVVAPSTVTMLLSVVNYG